VLNNRYIRKELELTARQVDQLHKLESDFATRYLQIKKDPNQFEDLDTKVEDSESHKAYRKAQQQVLKEHHTAAMRVLLPHQKKRLRQLVTQKFLHGNRYPFGAYLSDSIDKVIELDAEEKKKLQVEAKKQHTAFLKEYEELKRKYELKVRSILPIEQQKQLDDAMGEPYKNLQFLKF
jgi:hypothetical protein